jgi:Common central domain of tyrosinase
MESVLAWSYQIPTGKRRRPAFVLSVSWYVTCAKDLFLRCSKPVELHSLLTILTIAGIGIHGEPFISWDDVNGVDNPTFGGYCTHSSILFLTWHRPYLALYEVCVSKIPKFPSQNTGTMELDKCTINQNYSKRFTPLFSRSQLNSPRQSVVATLQLHKPLESLTGTGLRKDQEAHSLRL